MGRTFSRRLIHEAPVEVPDGAGGFLQSWTALGALWCEVRLRSGGLKPSEFGRRPQLQVRITTHAVPQDHPARPWPGHRLIDGRRIFLVQAVQESDLRDRSLTILANEIPTEGEPA